MSADRKKQIISKMEQNYGEQIVPPVREVVEFYEDLLQQIESEKEEAEEKVVMREVEHQKDLSTIADLAEMSSEKTGKVVESGVQAAMYAGLGIGLAIGFFLPELINVEQTHIVIAIAAFFIAATYHYAKMEGAASWV